MDTQQPLPQTPATPPEAPKPPDWSINDLYSKSWQTVKKHKVLWIFGIALGATQFSSNSSLDQKDIESLQKLFQNSQNNGEELSMVLGTSTSMIADIFSVIPWYLYVVGALELIVLVVIGFAVSVVYRSWAEAGLLEGIQTALANGSVTIRETSEKAFKSIRDIAYIRIIPILILVLAFFISIVIASFLPLLFLIIVPVMAIAVILLAFSQTWAVRKVIVDKTPAKQALSDGYKITKRKFWAMAGLGILNTLLRILVMAILIAPGIGILAAGFMANDNTFVAVPLFVFGGALMFIVLFGYEAVGGIITAFMTSAWSIAYQAIRGKYDK